MSGALRGRRWRRERVHTQALHTNTPNQQVLLKRWLTFIKQKRLSQRLLIARNRHPPKLGPLLGHSSSGGNLPVAHWQVIIHSFGVCVFEYLDFFSPVSHPPRTLTQPGCLCSLPRPALSTGYLWMEGIPRE